MIYVPRVPKKCPDGIQGRHVVIPGDTMSDLADFYRIPLPSLIGANPHIANPDQIFPGDVLCVPGQVPYPCCLVLRPVENLPVGSTATATVHIDSLGGQAISVVAVLPAPAVFGEFDSYGILALIDVETQLGIQLFPNPQDPPTWSATLRLPTAISLTPETVILLRPVNLETDIPGPTILRAPLVECCPNGIPIHHPDQPKPPPRRRRRRR